MTSPGRRFLAAVLTVLASVAMLVTLLAHYADHVLVSPAGFSDRAVSVVRTGAVQSLIVGNVTDRLLAQVGDQASLQPTIEAGVRRAVASPQITGQIRAAAESLHTQLVTGRANALTLTLPDAGSAIAASIESTSPQLAGEVARVGSITVLDVSIPTSAAKAVHDLATVGRDSTLLLVLTVALVLLALIIAPDRRRVLRALGLGALVSGLFAAALYLVGRGVVVDEFSGQDARTAAGAAWNVYLGGVETSGFVMAGAGAAVAFATALF